MFQQSPRLLSPGSGALSARYGWSAAAAAGAAGATALGGHGGHGHGGGLGSMASTPEEDVVTGGVEEDEDSGTGSTSNETHVIRHIDRNILACQICLHRYRLPKVNNACKGSFCKPIYGGRVWGPPVRFLLYWKGA